MKIFKFTTKLLSQMTAFNMDLHIYIYIYIYIYIHIGYIYNSLPVHDELTSVSVYTYIKHVIGKCI